MKNNGNLKIYSATLPSTTGSIDGASYVFADVPGIQVLMEAVDAGKNPSSKNVQKAIAAADAEAESSTSSSSSSSSTAGSNAVSQSDSSSSYGTDTSSDSTSGYDPNYNYNYGIDTANGGNVSGNNYGAVDD